jgi:hypothetical protein
VIFILTCFSGQILMKKFVIWALNVSNI